MKEEEASTYNFRWFLLLSVVFAVTSFSLVFVRGKPIVASQLFLGGTLSIGSIILMCLEARKFGREIFVDRVREYYDHCRSLNWIVAFAATIVMFRLFYEQGDLGFATATAPLFVIGLVAARIFAGFVSLFVHGFLESRAAAVTFLSTMFVTYIAGFYIAPFVTSDGRACVIIMMAVAGIWASALGLATASMRKGYILACVPETISPMRTAQVVAGAVAPVRDEIAELRKAFEANVATMREKDAENRRIVDALLAIARDLAKRPDDDETHAKLRELSKELAAKGVPMEKIEAIWSRSVGQA